MRPAHRSLRRGRRQGGRQTKLGNDPIQQDHQFVVNRRMPRVDNSLHTGDVDGVRIMFGGSHRLGDRGMTLVPVIMMMVMTAGSVTVVVVIVRCRTRVKMRAKTMPDRLSAAVRMTERGCLTQQHARQQQQRKDSSGHISSRRQMTPFKFSGSGHQVQTPSLQPSQFIPFTLKPQEHAAPVTLRKRQPWHLNRSHDHLVLRDDLPVETHRHGYLTFRSLSFAIVSCRISSTFAE